PVPDREDDGPNRGKKVSVALTARLLRNGNFSLTVNSSRPVESCNLDFLYAGKVSRVKSGKIWASRMFSGTTFTAEGSITRKGRRKSKHGKPLKYFTAARLQCADGSHGFSNIAALKPAKIKSRARNRLSLNRWFSELGRSIR